MTDHFDIEGKRSGDSQIQFFFFQFATANRRFFLQDFPLILSFLGKAEESFTPVEKYI
jgi:hypothetical protein